MSNLGRVLTSKKQFDEAETLLQRALDINSSSLGKRHHESGVVMTNLVFALIGRKELVEAEFCFREALSIARGVFRQNTY